MVVTVEIYATIRKMHLAGMSQRAIARELHISRKTVRKYMKGGYTPLQSTASLICKAYSALQICISRKIGYR